MDEMAVADTAPSPKETFSVIRTLLYLSYKILDESCHPAGLKFFLRGKTLSMGPTSLSGPLSEPFSLMKL